MLKVIGKAVTIGIAGILLHEHPFMKKELLASQFIYKKDAKCFIYRYSGNFNMCTTTYEKR